MEQVNRDEITLFIQNNENFYKRKFYKKVVFLGVPRRSEKPQ